MTTLLRKELSEWMKECLLAGLIGGVALAGLGRSVLDYGPPERGFDEGGRIWALFCLAAATCLGFWQLRQERTRGTQAYLHHRATGAGGAFRAKLLAGLLCLAVILALELGLHAAWFALFSGAAPVARWERVLDHLAVASLLVSGYGLGLWTSALPRGETTRLVLLVLGALSLYLLSALLSLRWDGGPAPSVARFVLAQLALGAALIVLAARLHGTQAEPDRPLRGPLALALVAPALLLFGLPVAQLPSNLQRSLRDEVLAGMPHIVRDRESGALLRVQATPAGFVPVDERGGAPAGALPLAGYTGWGYKPEHRYLTLYDPARTPLGWSGSEPPPLRREFAGKPFGFDGAFLHLRDVGRGPGAAWYERDTGRVLALVPGEQRAAGMRWLDKPGATRFSPDTVPVWASGAAESGACLVDRADGTAFRLVDGERGPELVAAPLPGGERLVDVERVHGAWRVGVGLIEPYGYSDQLVVRGESRLWAWSGEAWTPWAPPPGSVLESGLHGAIELRLRNADDDALLPRLELRDARDGTLLLSHRYAARSGGQWAALLGTYALTLARPPLFALAALGQPAAAFDRLLPGPLDRFVLDPALAGGRRPWLAALAFLLALLMARWAWAHIGPAPADRPRRVLWALLTALLGWPAFLALVLVEPRRVLAPGRAPTGDAAGEPERQGPLIASEA